MNGKLEMPMTLMLWQYTPYGTAQMQVDVCEQSAHECELTLQVNWIEFSSI